MNRHKQLQLILMCALVMLMASGTAWAEGSDRTAEQIEHTLNLANNDGQEWTYNAEADAWTLSVVSAVAFPELPDQQGLSVCVPGAYVSGIDTNGDGSVDIAAPDWAEGVKGALVIDYEAPVTSTNGQTYTAAQAPVIITTGAAGYGSQKNSAASTAYAGRATSA